MWTSPPLVCANTQELVAPPHTARLSRWMRSVIQVYKRADQLRSIQRTRAHLRKRSEQCWHTSADMSVS
jgi:hypothetical protein